MNPLQELLQLTPVVLTKVIHHKKLVVIADLLSKKLNTPLQKENDPTLPFAQILISTQPVPIQKVGNGGPYEFFERSFLQWVSLGLETVVEKMDLSIHAFLDEPYVMSVAEIVSETREGRIVNSYMAYAIIPVLLNGETDD